MRQQGINRRRFMEGAAAGIGFLAATRYGARASSVTGANDKVRLAMIGTGGQGTFHVGQWAAMKDVDIVALCDVDQGNLGRAAEAVGGSPRRTGDYRHILDMKDVDAVCVATPDHWHAIIAIEACRAGKAVYLEKPVAHNISEGRAIVDAARKHKTAVLHGTQQRSAPHWIHAVEMIKTGEIGKVSMIHAWNAWDIHGMFGDFGRPADTQVPAGVDYDRWLGPAPRRAFNPVRFHRTFYYFWDYSGGMVSGWGVHLFDIVMWAMGSDIRSVSTTGGKFVHDDLRDTPDTVVVAFECPGYNLYYSMRHGNGFQPYGDLDHGIEFFGTDGTLQINRLGFQVHDEGRREKPRHTETNTVNDPFEHKRHFLDCVRGDAKPKCDAESGHRASIYGHLANIAYRVGRRVRWDADRETILGDPEACDLLARTYREPYVLPAL